MCANAIIKQQTFHCTKVMFCTEPILKPLPVVGRVLNHQWRDGLWGKQHKHWHGDCSMSPIVFENVLSSSIGIFFNFIFAFQRHFLAVLEQFGTSLCNPFGWYLCVLLLIQTHPNCTEDEKCAWRMQICRSMREITGVVKILASAERQEIEFGSLKKKQLNFT